MVIFLLIGIFILSYIGIFNMVRTHRKNKIIKRLYKIKDKLGDYKYYISELKKMDIDEIDYRVNIILYKYECLYKLETYKDLIDPSEYDNVLDILMNIDRHKSLESHDTDLENDKIIEKCLKKGYLIEKYGKMIGDKLSSHKFFSGMSISQLLDTKGNPNKRSGDILFYVDYDGDESRILTIFKFKNDDLIYFKSKKKYKYKK